MRLHDALSGVFKDKAAILVRCWRPKDDETLCWKQQQRVCIMKPEASSFHNPRSYWKLTWGQKTDRLTPTLEESPRVRQSENEASVSSYLSTFRWVSPLESIPRCAHTVLASPTPRADMRLWRGSAPPKLGGWGSERPLLHCFPINLICLLDVGRPRWGRFSEAIPLSPHHPLRGMIRGYKKVTAPQSLYVVRARGRSVCPMARIS